MSEKMNITPLGMNILRFLARHPSQEFYVRQIASEIKKSVGGTQNALKVLEAQGFIHKRQSGKNLYYQVNEANPAVHHFKIFMSLAELQPLVTELKTVAEKIIVFGSLASGEDSAESDIDLLILTQEVRQVQNVVKKRTLSRKIQAIVLTASGLLKLKEQDKAFYQEINKGVVVWEKAMHE